MKTINFFLICLLFLSLASCGTSKRSVAVSENKAIDPPESSRTSLVMENSEEASDASERLVNPLALKISENAREFLGTRYKYGGTSKKGMDCSGLVYIAFSQEDIALPRISREMSLRGERLYLEEVEIGDLLFFETDKNRKVINHVGLVVRAEAEEIFFIHSSTSQGVIVSSLNNNYWQQHFVMARRVL